MASLSQHVIRSDKAVECCQRQAKIIQLELLGLVNQLISGVVSSKSGEVLALVPVGSAVTGAAMAKVVALGAETAAATVAVGGAVLLGSALQLLTIAQSAASIEAMAFVSDAINSYFDVREQPQLAPPGIGPRVATKTKTKSSCEECVERRQLQSGNKRQRQQTKILRRI